MLIPKRLQKLWLDQLLRGRGRKRLCFCRITVQPLLQLPPNRGPSGDHSPTYSASPVLTPGQSPKDIATLAPSPASAGSGSQLHLSPIQGEGGVRLGFHWQNRVLLICVYAFQAWNLIFYKPKELIQKGSGLRVPTVAQRVKYPTSP